ncbi:hypothetical protein [Jiangella anatolica]|nr:hypothetical protein [Jiangella anatolica]
MYKVTVEINPVEFEHVEEIVDQILNRVSLAPSLIHVDEVIDD